jgi:hypothetical protein
MRKFGLCHFLGRKFELCNFLCWKKCGKLDFIIFIGKKVQISKLFPNISELFHSEFRTLFGISCYGSGGIMIGLSLSSVS